MRKEDILLKKERFLKFAAVISDANWRFKKINRRWRGAITAGMIETGRMPKEATAMFAPLVQDMRDTIDSYENIQARLTDTVLVEMARKVILEIHDAAKFTINILKRNLFERTADVGYLATDGEIVNFLKCAQDKDQQDESFLAHRRSIQERLAGYRYEYTVYNEIIILDLNGTIMANLDENNRISSSKDPLLRQTQAVDLHLNADEDKYIETFRPTDLMPGRDNVLVYSQKIEDPQTQSALGTLCLCFDFEDEMKGIFQDLAQGNENIVAAILDSKGMVVSAGDTNALPLSTKVSINLNSEFDFITIKGKQYLVSTVPTDGYQGFYGLTWYGLTMINMEQAFLEDQTNKNQFNSGNNSILRNTSKNLVQLEKDSNNLLSKMKIDGLNGIIQADRFRDKSFVEIINFVGDIGKQVDTLFHSSIDQLQQTVTTSLLNDVQFRAFQGNNIADRNLYERANDVCWWALTPLFQKALTHRSDSNDFDNNEARELKENLQYINNLYTPYLRLILTDLSGEVVAVSDPPSELEECFAKEGLPKGQEFVGMKIEDNIVARALKLASSQDYCVTDFSPTLLYGGRPTYIYATAIRAPEDSHRIVGTILIVFDAQPQFAAMLSDILPKDENKQAIMGSFAVFADRQKNILSSTSNDFIVGQKLNIDDTFFDGENGTRNSAIVELNNMTYAMGTHISDGYREYKRGDGYTNDILCMVFIPT
nr:hypothetical protein [uncultured Desulfobacter sp.]